MGHFSIWLVGCLIVQLSVSHSFRRTVGSGVDLADLIHIFITHLWVTIFGCIHFERPRLLLFEGYLFAERVGSGSQTSYKRSFSLLYHARLIRVITLHYVITTRVLLLFSKMRQYLKLFFQESVRHE